MATIDVAVQNAVRSAVSPTYISGLLVANTYRIPNTGRTVLHFKKANAVVCTVTIATPNTIGGLAIADSSFVVPASGGEKIASGFDPALYNVPGTGYMEVTLSDVDGLTLAVYEPVTV